MGRQRNLKIFFFSFFWTVERAMYRKDRDSAIRLVANMEEESLVIVAPKDGRRRYFLILIRAAINGRHSFNSLIASLGHSRLIQFRCAAPPFRSISAASFCSPAVCSLYIRIVVWNPAPSFLFPLRPPFPSPFHGSLCILLSTGDIRVNRRRRKE